MFGLTLQKQNHYLVYSKIYALKTIKNAIKPFKLIYKYSLGAIQLLLFKRLWRTVFSFY